MYIGILTKISSNTNELRTDSIFGHFYELPICGAPFQMFAEPFEQKGPGYQRIVTTSTIKEVRYSKNWEDPLDLDTDIVFETLNSTYQLTNIRKAEDSHGSSENN